MSERLVVEISGDATKLNAALQSAINRLNSFNQRVTNSSRNLTNLNRQMAGMAASMASLSAASNSASSALNRVNAGTSRASVQMTNATRRTNGLTDSFRKMVVGLSSVQTMFYQYAFFVGGFVASVVKINAEYEKQMVLLKNLSRASTEAGRAMEAKKSQQYIWDMATKAPFSMQSITDAFVKLKVGGVDPTNGSMKALVDSVAAFGGSSENLKRAAVAIQQMGGKGVVSMEELRQQLGEAVPNAMKLMATSMNMTMRDFVKAVSKGTVESTNALNKMFVAMKIENGGAAEAMMNTWSGLMARLTTAYSKFVINVSNSGGAGSFFQTLKKQAEELIHFLNTPLGLKFAQDVSEALARIVIGIGNAIKFLYEWRDTIVAVAKVFFAVWAGRQVMGVLTGVGGAMRALTTIGNGVYGTVGKLTRFFIAWGNSGFIVSSRLAVLARNCGLVNTAATASIRNFGLLAARAMIAAGAIGILTGIVWGLVAALNAKNAAEQRAANLKKMADNKTYMGEEDREAEKKRLLSEKRLLEIRAKQINSMHVGPQRNAQLVKFKKDLAAFKENAKNFQEIVNSSNEIDFDQAVSNWEYSYNRSTDSIISNVKANYDKRTEAIEKNIKDEKEKTKAINENYKQFLKEQAVALDQRIVSLNKTIANPPKNLNAAALAAAKKERDRLKEKLAESANDLKTLGDDNVFMSDPNGKDKKDKSDGLDGLRNRLISLKVNAAELHEELNGTIEDFDTWEAEQKATGEVEGLNKDQLRQGIALTKDKIQADKDQLKIRKAQIDLDNEVDENSLEATASLFEMRNGYRDVASEVENYRNRLQERYQVEINLARIADGNAKNDSTIKGAQEQALWNGINNATLERQIAIVNQLGEKAKDIYEDRMMQLMTADERREFLFQKEIRRLQYELVLAEALGDRGKETAENIRNAIQALGDVNKEKKQAGPLAQWAREASDWRENMMQASTGLLDGFVDDLAQGKFAFKDFAKSLLADLLKIILRAMIAKAILSAIYGGSAPNSAEFGANPSGGAIGMHNGGVVGRDATFHRQVDASLFAFAQRYHSGGIVGLRPNEVPIIAEKGETVLTKDQTKSLGNKGSNVTVNVINQTGTETEVERKPAKFDGEKWVEDIILKKITKPGPVRSVLGSMNQSR